MKFLPNRAADAVLAASGVLLLVGTVMLSGLHPPPFGDSDTLTRIAWLRDAGFGGILDPVFDRDGAPDGMLLQWTFPFNALSLAWISLLGEAGARAWSGLAAMGLLCFAALPALRPLGARRAWPWLPVFAALAIIVVAYAQPGRLNHHPWTAASAMLCLALAMSLRTTPTAGRAAAAGAACALAMWQSMETVPAVVLAWGFLWASAAERPSAAKALARGFAIGAAALIPALAADGPWPHFHPFTPHRLSLFHAFLLFGMAVAAFVVRPLKPRRAGAMASAAALLRAAWPSAVVLGGCAGVAMIATPRSTHGPLFDDYFWSSVGELVSVTQAPAMVLPALAIPALVGLVWVGLAAKRPTPFRMAAAGGMACCILLGMVWVRMATYPQILALPLGAALAASALGTRTRVLDSTLTRMMVAKMIGLIGVLMIALALFAPALPAKRATGSASCLLSAEAGNVLEETVGRGGTVMADVWLTPGLLHATSTLRGVGGPYHGNSDGVERAAAFMTLPADAAADAAAESGAVFALLCAAPWYVAARPWTAGSVMDSLAREGSAGHPRFEPVPLPGGGGLRLFRIRQNHDRTGDGG